MRTMRANERWPICRACAALAMRVAAQLSLYLGILILVAVVAVLIGLTTLQDGQWDYLLHPRDLLWYVWAKRAGLKVQILFVSALLFLMVSQHQFRNRR